MATTQNTYTGNGSLTEYSFTFPYLEESDVKVSLDGVDQATSEYSFANATTISFNTAPANGVAIRIRPSALLTVALLLLLRVQHDGKNVACALWWFSPKLT